MTPPPSRARSSRPAAASRGANALRAPALAPTSQIWRRAFEPAAASVSGSSGDHAVVKTLPCAHRQARTPHEGGKAAHHAEVAARDERDVLDRVVRAAVERPDLDELVRPARREAPAHVRVHVQRGDGAVVRLQREARGARRALEARRGGERARVEAHDHPVLERDLQGGVSAPRGGAGRSGGRRSCARPRGPSGAPRRPRRRSRRRPHRARACRPCARRGRSCR
jgi:hypothetical protein